jgi:hypothetical protein
VELESKRTLTRLTGAAKVIICIEPVMLNEQTHLKRVYLKAIIYLLAGIIAMQPQLDSPTSPATWKMRLETVAHSGSVFSHINFHFATCCTCPRNFWSSGSQLLNSCRISCRSPSALTTCSGRSSGHSGTVLYSTSRLCGPCKW